MAAWASVLRPMPAAISRCPGFPRATSPSCRTRVGSMACRYASQQIPLRVIPTPNRLTLGSMADRRPNAIRGESVSELGDMQKLLEVHGERQVGRGRIREEKAGVLRRNARLERLVVELTHAAHEREIFPA